MRRSGQLRIARDFFSNTGIRKGSPTRERKGKCEWVRLLATCGSTKTVESRARDELSQTRFFLCCRTMANFVTTRGTPSAHASGYLNYFTGQTRAEPSRLPEIKSVPSALKATV